jgi:hypothetical protein
MFGRGTLAGQRSAESGSHSPFQIKLVSKTLILVHGQQTLPIEGHFGGLGPTRAPMHDTSLTSDRNLATLELHTCTFPAV